MVFSSISFLYYFLAIALITYFVVPKNYKNLVLFTTSIAFYFYGEKIYTILMLVEILVAYISGIMIEKYKGTKKAKYTLIGSIVLCLGLLTYFKYANFLVANLTGLLNIEFKALQILLPIGISFYTFQIISYIIDVYRGEVEAQKSFLKLGTYVSMFPQLIAGPIVRYVDVNKELTDRKITIEMVSHGIRRFVIGLGKKVLLANSLASLCETFKATDEKSVLFFWIYALANTLYIYFDFSGYSDMAIGIGKVLGFNFLENFNYPLISKSITEFWRRWHISLGTWFKDYLYIPLGGNRVSKPKFIRNIFVVWGLTGLWHGADWNFIIWGIYFGVLLCLEKIFLKKLLDKAPSIISRIYVLFIILLSFVIFDSTGMDTLLYNFKGLFGALSIPFNNATTSYYLKSFLITILVACISATPIIKEWCAKLAKKDKAEKVINVLEIIMVMTLLVVTTAYLIDDSFNPFLYFRF